MVIITLRHMVQGPRFDRTQVQKFFKRRGCNGAAQTAPNGRPPIENRNDDTVFALSPDGTAFLRANNDVNQLLAGTGDVSLFIERYRVSALELKMKLFASKPGVSAKFR